jgi:autophagy-related protein 2
MSRFDQEDSESINTEMRDLLDFETSVMGLKSVMDADNVEEALPQVVQMLGDVKQIEIERNTGRYHTATTQTRKISSDTDDDFCFIAEEEKVQYPSGLGQQQQQPEVPVTDDPIRIIDNHFSLPIGKPDLLKAPKDFPMASMRYTLCEMSLVWHMYGGNDFNMEDDKKKGTTTDTSYVQSWQKNLPMSEAYKVGVSYSKGSPSVTLGVNPLLAKLTWKTRGGRHRKHDVLMEIHVNKVRFSHEIYPTNTEQASRQVLLITELEIRDRLAVSNINKFLYHPSVGLKTKGAQHMVVVKILHLRPDPALSSQECCLRISLLPLRLNIDQDSLLFLVNFFNELGGGGGSDSSDAQTSGATNRRHSTTSSSSASSSHIQPVMMVEIPEAAQELQARKMIDENLLKLMHDDETKEKEESTESVCEQTDDSPIYFR